MRRMQTELLINILKYKSMKKENRDRQRVFFMRRKMIQSLQILNLTSPDLCEEIDLSQNFIEDISPISSYKFNTLLLLNLSINLIDSVEPLKDIQFPLINKLYLHGNRISSMEPLSRCKMPKLKELKLGCLTRGNEIIDISCIRHCLWRELEELYFDSNNLFYLQPLREAAFPKLTHLYLGNNQIASIESLALVNIPHLKVLSLKDNFLTNIRILSKCWFPELEYLNLCCNVILELGSFPRAFFPQLSKLNLIDNGFCAINDIFKCDWKHVSTIMHNNAALIYRQYALGQLYQKFLAEPAAQ